MHTDVHIHSYLSYWYTYYLKNNQNNNILTSRKHQLHANVTKLLTLYGYIESISVNTAPKLQEKPHPISFT